MAEGDQVMGRTGRPHRPEPACRDQRGHR